MALDAAQQPINLVLRGKDVAYLRDIAARHCGKSVEELEEFDKPTLVSLITRSVEGNRALSREISKGTISIKPSFYLMVLSPKGILDKTDDQIRHHLNVRFGEVNSSFVKSSETVPYKEFKLVNLLPRSGSFFEIHLTWQRVHWYWHPTNFSLAHVYELRFGVCLLDFVSRKAIIACQTTYERDVLSKSLQEVFPINLSPLVLTRPILNQIGTFDRVKRATYFLPNPDAKTPANISYADENLGAKPLAREEEEDLRSERKQSFYMIPLGTIVEQGIGATSDSGKLWIPRQLSLDTIRNYAAELLAKIGSTLDDMTKAGQISQVLDALGISQLQGVSQIQNLYLRNDICTLIEELVNMIISRQTERPFSISRHIAVEAVPRYFQFPRLQVEDAEAGVVAFWSNSDRSSSSVRLTEVKQELSLFGHPGGEVINLQQVRHPITGVDISIQNPLNAIELIPTLELHQILLSAIQHIGQQIPEIRKVLSLPFFLKGGRIVFDVERAVGGAGIASIGTQLMPTDIQEFAIPLRVVVRTGDRKNKITLLRQLGEKCRHMNDDNCSSCIADSKYLCMRSLVARYLTQPILLAHKRMELSDLHASLTVGKGQEKIRIFGFSKLAKGNGGLTARNNNGAILLSQVLGQVDKSTFDTVVVVSPSPINEDLADRLKILTGVFGKKLLVLGQEELVKLLVHFEEQSSFDKVKVKSMYQASRKK